MESWAFASHSCKHAMSLQEWPLVYWKSQLNIHVLLTIHLFLDGPPSYMALRSSLLRSLARVLCPVLSRQSIRGTQETHTVHVRLCCTAGNSIPNYRHTVNLWHLHRASTKHSERFLLPSLTFPELTIQKYTPSTYCTHTPQQALSLH